MFSRTEAVEAIKKFVLSQEKITAAWEGGSVATGYDDEVSDLDLCMVCKDDDTEEVLNRMVGFLRETFGEDQIYRLPEPTYHGFSQVFFKTKNTPPLFYVDFGVMGESLKDKYVEENRHGQAKIWVEKYKLDCTNRPKEKIEEVSRGLYEKLIAIDFLLILELKKALHRGVFSEAFPAYYGFITRCLVVLLNIKHRPAKADFGMRYIYRDYPKEDYLLVEDALRVKNMEEMTVYADELLELYNQLKLEMKQSS